MPLYIFAVLAGAAGLKYAGNGINDAGNGALKIALAACAVGVVFYMVRPS